MLRWKASLKPTDGGGGGVSLPSDVLLYVPFTDADGSTGADGYVKSSGGHTLTSDVFTRSGNAVINTDQTKMTGSSTAAYNPAGANSDGWELDSTISAGLEVGSSSPLSIQFWFYCSNDGSGSSARLLGWDGWHTSGSGIEFETLSTDYDRFIFYEHTGATTSRRSIGDHVLNANAWNHIYWAFQPSGSSYLGINGTVTEASGSYITNFAPTVDLNLLKTPANADDAVKGYVQEFIVKNTVPYTSNFTPSTTPLVSSGGGGDNPGTTNLVAWLGMDEGSGTSVDDSTSNNNDFTLTNGTWVGSGKVGSNAVRLDGSGDYISSDSALTIGSKICTVSFWMDWTKVGSGEKYLYELGNRWWQTDGSITLKWDQSNTRFLAAMQDSTSGTKYLEVAFPEPSDGQWVYVTVVYNGTANSNAGEIKLYYDGVEQSSSSTPTNTKDQASDFTSSTLYIGANSTGGEEITVDLDTFAIFSDELTSSEITWLYNSGSGRSYSDVSGGGGSSFPSTSLVGFYKLNEASGADAADSSGNGYDFSDNGTVASTTGTIGGETVNVRTLDRPAGKYFSLTDNANFDVGDGEDFTIAFWAKLSSSMGDYTTGGIFSKRHAVSASDAGYSIALSRFPSQPTRIRYNEVSDGTSEVGDTNSNTSVAQDAWGHFMMVFTADSTLVTYVNNVQYNSVDASSVTGALTNTKDNYIGQLAYNNNGSIIADVTHLGFWKKALDSSERTALYNSGKVLAPAAPSGPAGDALILNGVTNNSTGGVETSARTDGSSTVYGGYAIGNMDFRDGTKDGSWTDDGLGLFFDQSSDGTNWQTLLGTAGGTFSIYEEGTSTLIFSLAWTGEQNWTGNTHQYGQTTKDYTGTVPSSSTRIDVYHVKS